MPKGIHRKADPGGASIDTTLDELAVEWRLLAELHALANRTGRVRFGPLPFLAASERVRLTGSYRFGARNVYEFDDARQHTASGSKGRSHGWWHEFNEKKRNEPLRAHAHRKTRRVASVLEPLAAEESREAKGRSLPEGSLITTSTESGDGRPNHVRRGLAAGFHAVSGAGGRFKRGSGPRERKALRLSGSYESCILNTK